MKKQLFISFLLIFGLKGFGQEARIIGKYYNGLGTQLIIEKDNKFSISHTPPIEGCIADVFSSDGTWKLQNDTIKLIPILDNTAFQFNKIEIADTLSIDTLYLRLSTFFENEYLPFANIVLFSSTNKIIGGTTSDFDGFAKIKKIDFSYILVTYGGYTDAKIESNDITGNMIIIKMARGGSDKYLTEEMHLIQKRNGTLKVIKGHKDGYTFRKLK